MGAQDQPPLGVSPDEFGSAMGDPLDPWIFMVPGATGSKEDFSTLTLLSCRPLQLHRLFAQAIGARIAVYRGGHSPCETSPHQFSRDLLALYAKDSGPA